jgi:hypothetical protein
MTPTKASGNPHSCDEGSAARLAQFCALILSAMALLVCLASGCTHPSKRPPGKASEVNQETETLRVLKANYAPDNHLGVYSVGLQARGRQLVLTGEVDNAGSKLATVTAFKQAGLVVSDEIRMLPSADLGGGTWGIACLSVASAREQPEHKAEMGTQVLMGGVVRVLKAATNHLWFYAQSADGYLAWLEKGTFVRCTHEQVRAWTNSPLLVVTAFEDSVVEAPQPDAEPVSDVVIADLVKKTGEEGEWYQVELPDGRNGFLRKSSVMDYQAWRCARQATAENIERTGRRFLGRPYLWGGNSPKGLDCSGFVNLVYYLNGIELNRNASQQARQGMVVPLDADLSRLKKGDLLFFGRRARGDREARVAHVGIYLGDKLFIHSSERVQINSLDPASPIRDERRIRTLLEVRRVLPE